MASESKPEDASTSQAAAEDIIAESKSANAAQVEFDHEEEADDSAPTEGSANGTAKKKKSKKKRIKAALGMGKDGAADPEKQKEEISKAVSGLSKAQIQELLSMNPSLAQELAESSDGKDLSGASAAEQMRKLKVGLNSANRLIDC